MKKEMLKYMNMNLCFMMQKEAAALMLFSPMISGKSLGGEFDGEPYDGSIVNMGVKNADGSVCYIIGVCKEIRVRIGKHPGDVVRVTIRERN